MKFQNFQYLAVNFRKSLTLRLPTSLLSIVSLLTILLLPNTKGAELFGIYETQVTNSNTYSNPFDFTVIELQTQFTAPSGAVFNYFGFYDGDGNGGQNGNIWKIRFMPTELGNWSYTYSWTDGTPGGSGTFNVTDSGLPGPLKVDPANPWFFVNGRNQPFNFRGYDLHILASYSPTSNIVNDVPWVKSVIQEEMINNGFNFTMIDGTIDRKQTQNGNWEQSYWLNNTDTKRFNISTWKAWDEIYGYCNQNHIYVINFAGMIYQKHQYGITDFKVFLRYWLARFGSYYNYFGWSPTWEWHDIWSSSTMNQIMQFLYDNDPWKRLLSAHDHSNNSFSGWLGFSMRQQQSRNIFDGNLHGGGQQGGVGSLFSDLPIIGSEDIWEYWDGAYGQPRNATEIRRGAWGIQMAGVMPLYSEWHPNPLPNGGEGTGMPEVKRMFEFYYDSPKVRYRDPNFQQLNNLVSASARQICSGVPGVEYLVYDENGGSITIDLSGANANTSFQVIWFNPTNGALQTGNNVSGGGSRSFSSPFSNDTVLLIRIPSDTTPPSIPQNLTATPISENEIQLQWNASNDQESSVTHYNVYRDGTIIASALINSFSDNGLDQGISYNYEVTAVNGVNLESAKSSPPITASTLSDTTPPTIISVLTPGNATEVRILFSEPIGQSGAETTTNFVIDQGISISNANLGSDLKTVTLTTNQLQQGTTYTLTVNNVQDRANPPNTIASNTQESFSIPVTLPQPPSNLTATPVSPTSINLEWTDNSQNESGFRIERTTGEASTIQVSLISYNSNNNPPTIETEGSANSFKVGAYQVNDRSSAIWSDIPASLAGATRLLTARNDKGDSGYNSLYTINLNTAATIFAAVSPQYGNAPMEFMDSTWTDTGLTATTQEAGTFKMWKKEGTAGNLTLGADDANDKQGACYVFQSNATWTELATVGANVTTFQDTNLPANSTFTYRIRAVNNSGASESSNESSATTLSANTQPSVDAGDNITIASTSVANLAGTVSDDGLPNPPGSVTIQWSKESGPGDVTFENGNSAATSASFSKEGPYVLRLTADDGEFSTFDELNVTVISNGLLAYFPFDENSDDESGSGFHGEIFGASPTTGILDKAYEFDGDNDYIAIQGLNFSDQGALETLSVCAWVQTTFSGTDAFSNWSIVDFDRNEYFSFFIHGVTGQLGFSTTDENGNTDDFYGNVSVNDGKWHYVCAIYDGSDKILYVDGAEDHRNPDIHSGLKLGSGLNTRYGFIGDGSEANVYNGDRNYSRYEGLIDELKLYNKILSANEIQQQFNEFTLPDPNDGLLIRYSFDGNTNNTVGTSNHGMNFGASPVSGVSGQAYEFDGNNDYIAVEDLSFNSPGEINALTICGWIRTTFSGNNWFDNWALFDFDRSEYFALFVRGDSGTLGFSTTDSDGNSNDFFGSTPVNDGEWHFVAAVYNGKDKILYVDGIENAKLTNAHGGKNLGSGANTRYGFIGDGSEASKFNGARNGIYYNGLVDEFDFYTRALSRYEIQNKFQEVTIPNSDQELVLSYPFDGDATDNSGNDFNGHAQGVTSVPGKVGLAYHFDGDGDYIAIESLKFSNQGQIKNVTVCSWVNTTYSGGNAFDNWSILDFDRNEYFSFYVRGDNGRLGFSTTDSDGNTRDFYGSREINDGDWHLACAVYNGDDKILYVDGVEDRRTGNAHSGKNLGSGNTVRFGFVGDGSEADGFNQARNLSYFSGSLDEVKLYSRALASLEIKMMYSNAQGIVSSIVLNSTEDPMDLAEPFPFNPQYPGEPISWTMYEDAEDGMTLGWFTYNQGTIENISDGAFGSERAIKTDGLIDSDVFRLGTEDGKEWNNEKEFYLEFSVLFQESGSGAVYFQLNTSAGVKYLMYTDGEGKESNDPDVIANGLGDIADGEWHSIFRSLEQDLHNLHPEIQLLSVKDMFVYGSLFIDEIKLIEFASEENE